MSEGAGAKSSGREIVEAEDWGVMLGAVGVAEVVADLRRSARVL